MKKRDSLPKAEAPKTQRGHRFQDKQSKSNTEQQKNELKRRILARPERKGITGITKRWATNTLLVTALILFVVVVACTLFIVQYYRNYVVSYLSGYANERFLNSMSPLISLISSTEIAQGTAE